MMKFKFLLTSAALIAVAAPAGAAVTVLGSSNARMCYEAADTDAPPIRTSLEACDTALNGEAASTFDIVATHVNRGILRSRLGDLEGAMTDFDAALAIDPNQPEAYLNKGVALIRKDNPDAALPLFTMALEKKTRRPALAYYGRGIAHEELGNIKSAYADYKRAVAEAPNWKEPKRDLARFVVR
jgi:tetratricopeptide (TPR) repeat protein